MADVIPEWVHVWGWLRVAKGDDRPMPQQFGHVDPLKMMDWEEFETQRQAWKAAGAPPVWKTYGLSRPSVQAESPLCR